MVLERTFFVVWIFSVSLASNLLTKTPFVCCTVMNPSSYSFSDRNVSDPVDGSVGTRSELILDGLVTDLSFRSRNGSSIIIILINCTYDNWRLHNFVTGKYMVSYPVILAQSE